MQRHRCYTGSVGVRKTRARCWRRLVALASGMVFSFQNFGLFYFARVRIGVTMCRLFGFHSRLELPVYPALVTASNALARQSQHHPHGWGLAYYDGLTPCLRKGTMPAYLDEVFTEVCEGMLSCTVVAHVRQATVGLVQLTNTHPFQFGRWSFAHNGTVYGFQQLRPYFLEEIAPELRPHIQGTTDSEHCFFLLLSELMAHTDLEAVTRVELEECLTRTLQKIVAWCRQVGIHQQPCMNFMVTDGSLFAVTRLGRELLFCAELSHPEFASRSFPLSDGAARGLGTDRALADQVEVSGGAPGARAARRAARYASPDGREVHWVRVASERISEEDPWEEVPDNAILTADEDLRLRIRRDICDLRGLEHVPMPTSSLVSGISC